MARRKDLPSNVQARAVAVVKNVPSAALFQNGGGYPLTTFVGRPFENQSGAAVIGCFEEWFPMPFVDTISLRAIERLPGWRVVRPLRAGGSGLRPEPAQFRVSDAGVHLVPGLTFEIGTAAPPRAWRAWRVAHAPAVPARIAAIATLWM